MSLNKREMDSVLSMLYLWEFKKPKEDKHYQQFKLFLNRKDVDALIVSLRKKKGIKTPVINSKLRQFDNTLNRKDKIFRKVRAILKKENLQYDRHSSKCHEIENKAGHTQIKKRCEKQWAGLQKHVDSRISVADVDTILNKYKMPWSWQYPLCCYVLTNKVLNPQVRCRVYSSDDKILIEMSAEATKRDIERNAYRIEGLQKYLPGYNLKKTRIRKKLDEKLNIKKDHEKYRILKKHKVIYHVSSEKEVTVMDNKEQTREELVTKYNKKAFLASTVRKEWKRQKQIYRRYKS